MEQTEQKENLSITVFKKQLENAGVDISKWGTGGAKTVEHLKGEIDRDESILEEEETGEFVRKVSIVGANVYYISPTNGRRYRLKEDRQIFLDGRERRRDYGHAVSEKMKPGEDPKTAMIRGIQEELGINGLIDPLKTWEDEKVSLSPSYPGLISNYIRYGFDVILNENQFEPEGYIEEQEKMNTYFVCEEVNKESS